MEVLTISELKNKINPKKVKGDYVTMGKMLGIEGNNARMQYERNKPEAVVALYLIISKREKLIINAEKLIKEFINNNLK